MIDSGWMMTSICSGSQIEQPARLDDLQGLVHHGGRIDADLRPHPPGRMPQRLGDRHIFEIDTFAATKRTAAGREHHACHLAERWPARMA